jgi:hypothetical protein
MKLLAKLSLTLALALSLEVYAWPQEVARGQVQVSVDKSASVRSSTPAVPVPSATDNYRGATRYATEFDGDHSLEAATVAEQVFGRYSLYTVQLQFASGDRVSGKWTSGCAQHDDQLFASQQSPRDEQISSSNTRKQTSRARKISGCHLAGRFASGEQINTDSVVGVGERILAFVPGNARRADCGVFRGLLDPNGPRFFSGSAISV